MLLTRDSYICHSRPDRKLYPDMAAASHCREHDFTQTHAVTHTPSAGYTEKWPVRQELRMTNLVLTYIFTS